MVGSTSSADGKFAKELFGDDFAETLAGAGDQGVEIFEFHSGTGVSPVRFSF